MNPPNLHGRVFVPVKNSEAGTVRRDTLFVFTQDGLNFAANYSGGSVQEGHLMGRFDTDITAQIVYHCRTDTNTLKVGKALAKFDVNPDMPLQIRMDWEWLSGDVGKGQSQYKELHHEP